MRLAFAQHGVFARWQLTQAGVAKSLIDERIRRHRLDRLHRCVFRVAALSGAREREAAAVLAFGPDAVASHRTAAEISRLLPASDAAPVISLSRGHPRQRIGITMHRVQLDTDERIICDGIAATSPARTILDLAADIPDRDLEQALATGLRLELVTESAVLSLLDRYPGRPGSARVRALLAAGSAPVLTRSEAEQRFLLLVRRAAIPTPAVNARVRGFEVDFYWRSQRLVVEVDGLAWHSSRSAQERDRHRDTTLAAAGIRVLRFTWSDVTTRMEWTLARVVSAIAQSGV